MSQAESPIEMFFDKDLSPVSYVNSIYQSILESSDGNERPSATHPKVMYSAESLARLSSSISSLVAHLDYHTSELSSNLTTQINILRQNSAKLGQKCATDQPLLAEPSTRLEYYVNMLKNSILSLESDLSAVNKQIADESMVYFAANQNLPDPIGTLADLKAAKANLERVVSVFTTIHELAPSPESKDSVSPKQFEDMLHDAQQALQQEMAGPSAQNAIPKIEALIELLAVFQGSNRFFPIYKKFSQELERLLNQHKIV